MSDFHRMICEAFPEKVSMPPMSLRAGDRLDDGLEPLPFDRELDRPTRDYLDRHMFGLHYLDAASWQHYLPILLTSTFEHFATPSNHVDLFLMVLSSASSELHALAPEQKAVIIAMLEHVAFGQGSIRADEAMLALQQYWWPHSDYGEGSRN